MTWLILLAALQPARPEKPLDPKDARSVAEHALYATRTQQNYTAAFKSLLKPAKGDAFKREGTCLWTASGLLSLNATGSGGEETNVLRAGDRVWVRSFDAWTDAGVAGKDGAGRGIQNPDEILAVLGRHLDKAVFTTDRAVAVTLGGDDLRKLVPEGSEFDPAKSAVTIRLEADRDGRVKKIGIEASLQTPAGKAGFTAEIEVTGYNQNAAPKAIDSAGKEIPYSTAILKEIEARQAKR